MLRTVFASAAFVLAGGLCASWLTEGFEVYTAEGARRRAVALSPVSVTPATLIGTGLHGQISGQSLQSLLVASGRVTVVTFIYTRCPTVCKALGSSFQQLQAAIAAQAVRQGDNSASSIPPSDIRLLSISFDPVHDGIEQLNHYAALWRAHPRHWQVVTVPDVSQLRALLKAWQVVVIPDGLGGHEHNAALLVVDAQGRLVRIFEETDSETALAFATMLGRDQQAKSLP